MFEEIKAICRSHYEYVLRQHGDSPQGVNWADADSQRLRFQIICDVGNLNGRKIEYAVDKSHNGVDI